MSDYQKTGVRSGYDRALGVLLRAERARHGLSLHGVEDRSQGQWKAVVVGSYERGDRSLSVEKFALLAKFYGVRPASLLPDTEAGQ